MHWRSKRIKWLSGVYAAVALGLLCLLILGALPAVSGIARRMAADFFYPYLNISGRAKSATADKSLLLLSKTELAAALTAERKELAAARIQAERAGALARENGELRTLLQLTPLPDYRYIAAEVQTFDPLYWKEHFTLNRGEADGVKPGLAVITIVADSAGGALPVVAGFVRSTALHSCEVVTLYNSSLRMPLRLQRSGANGFLNGENQPMTVSPGLAAITYLPNHANYVVGDLAVTTDFDHDIPPGLRLGELVRMTMDDSIFGGNLYRTGELRPALPGLDDARFMMIIAPDSAGQEP